MILTHACSGRAFAYAALISGAACIAFAPIFVRLSELGPISTALYRVALAMPMLLLWQRLDTPEPRSHAPKGADFLLLALAGWFFAADLAVWHWSIQLTSVANATLLANFAPVFVTLGSWLLFGERFGIGFLVALVVGLAGAAIMMGDSLSLDRAHLAGDLLGLLTAVFYGAYILTVSRLRRRFSTRTIMLWSTLICALTLWPLAALSEPEMLAHSLRGWLILLALAAISHVGGQSLIAFALAQIPAALSSLALLLQPVIAALLAWWLLGEGLRSWQLAGGVLVLAAIVLAQRALATRRTGAGSRHD